MAATIFGWTLRLSRLGFHPVPDLPVLLRMNDHAQEPFRVDLAPSQPPHSQAKRWPSYAQSKSWPRKSKHVVWWNSPDILQASPALKAIFDQIRADPSHIGAGITLWLDEDGQSAREPVYHDKEAS